MSNRWISTLTYHAVICALLLPVAQAQSSTPSDDANNKLMARASALYYSTERTGLKGFDCTLQPDWYTLFVSFNRGNTISHTDPRIVLLNRVKSALHVSTEGSATLDWTNPDDPSVDDANQQMLKQMRDGAQQTLEGFAQFWSLFINGSAVPSNASGLRITTIDDGYRAYTKSGDVEVASLYDSKLLLMHFNVISAGTVTNIAPIYRGTTDGLLVEKYRVRMGPVGTPEDKLQELNVDLDYAPVGKHLVPSEIKVVLVGTGEFDFALSGCTVR